MKTAAEKSAYSQGYAAGKKRVEREDAAADRERVRREFAERIYISMLPAAMLAQGWTIADKPITSTEGRVDLAVRWTAQAMKRRHEI